MTEKLVDILNASGNVIHTYPVTLDSRDDADFRKKGLEAAASAQLIPDAELWALTARIHRGREGPDGAGG
jgi:hypothetical protein